MRPRSLLALASASIVALAGWVTPGVLAVTDASSLPRAVGLLPPWWTPLVIGGVAALLLWRAPRRLLWPLCLPVVLLWPWLPIGTPAAAFVWAGPMVLWVWMGTAAAAAAVSWPHVAGCTRLRRWLVEPRRATWLAFALALVVFYGTSRLVAAVIPGGDEPHYLVITQSLLLDGDLQIENNHRRGDYRVYHAGDLRPDYLRRGTNRQIYSIHAPGLPAVIAPAFALGGYPLVVFFLASVSAFGAMLVWRSAYRLTGQPDAAWFGWASVALSAPVVFHACAVYPDAAGAVLVMTGVSALLGFEPPVARHEPEVAARLGFGGGAAWSVAPWGLVGAALALLPWLHTRYATVAAVLGACLAARLVAARWWRRLAALTVVPTVSAAVWFGYFHVIYGTWSPSAPYGHEAPARLANLPRGLAALWLDHQFGVLPNAPAYLAALLGLAVLIRIRRRLGLEIAVLLLGYLGSVAAFHMWWGGWSAPARFVVPMLPMLGLPAAVFWARQRVVGRAVGVVLIVLTALITLTLACADSGWLIYNTRDGVGRLHEWLCPLVDLPRACPSFLRGSTAVALAVAGIWAGAACLAVAGLRWLAASRAARGADPRAGLALAAPLALVGSVSVAVAMAWAIEGIGGATPTPSALTFLRAYDPASRPIGVDLRNWRAVAPDTLVSRLSLATFTRRPQSEDAPLLVLTDVPAGTYRLSRSTAMVGHGVLSVLVGRSRRSLVEWVLEPSDRDREYRLHLATSVNAIVVAGDPSARRSLSRLAIEPVSVVPRSARPTRDRGAAAAVYDQIVVYAMDSLAYLEDRGVWLEGGVEVRLVVSPVAPAPTVSVRLRNAPVPNRVVLRSGEWREDLPMAPGEERTVRIPVDPVSGGAAVVIRAETGFRPAEVQAGSQDARLLGVWLEPAPR